MDLFPDSARRRRFALNCETLRLKIEFSLGPGEFARIGSSPDMEIPLPMVGIREEECRLLVDDTGLLWIFSADATDPLHITPPATLHAGPYHFTIAEQRAESATVAALPVQARPSEARIVQPPSPRARRKAVAAATVAVTLVASGVLWRVFREPDAPSIQQDSASTASASAANASAPDTIAQPTPKPDPEPAPAPSPPPPETLDLEKLAKRVSPCVFLLRLRDESGAIVPLGTGFAISPDGMLATNHHVIKKGGMIEAITEQGATFSVTRVLTEDPEADLAILQLDARNLLFLQMGDSAAIAPGKRVAVYGSPVGLAGTLSEGIISAIRREPAEGLPNNGELLQTTAPVSPGSSGSPLLDADGNVLGIITLSSGGRAQNINFAVPVEALRSLKVRAGTPGLSAREKHTDLSTPEGKDDATADTRFHADPERSELRAFMDAKDWIAALKLAGKLAKKHPESAAAHFCNGYCATSLELDQQAEASYERALSLDPSDEASWNNLGSLKLKRGETRQALNAYEHAVQCAPDSPIPWANLLRSCVLLKEWRRAASAMGTLRQLNSAEAWEVADQIQKFRIPDAALQREIKAALENKKGDILLKPTLPDKPGESEFIISGVPAGDTLAVRSGPGTDFAQIASLANGVAGITIIGGARNNGSTEWIPIAYQGGHGWVRSKYLKPKPKDDSQNPGSRESQYNELLRKREEWLKKQRSQ